MEDVFVCLRRDKRVYGKQEEHLVNDITMCTSIDCPMKDTCYRIQATPEPRWQSYANFEYTCNENSGYEDYIRIEGGRKDGNM